MASLEGQIVGYTCDVYSVTNAQMTALDLDPAGKTAWNSAPFYEKIVVRITGTYKPVIPNLIGFDTDVPFTITVMMSSEAN